MLIEHCYFLLFASVFLCIDDDDAIQLLTVNKEHFTLRIREGFKGNSGLI